MKNCVVCGKALRSDSDVCGNCYSFLKWKYKDKYKSKIGEFKILRDSSSTKCHGRIK